jgi:hypothetical protein
VLTLLALGVGVALIEALSDSYRNVNLYGPDGAVKMYTSEAERAAYARIGNGDPAAGLARCLRIHGYKSLAEQQDAGVMPKFPPPSRMYDPGCPIYGGGR